MSNLVQHPLQGVRDRRTLLGLKAADFAKRLGMDIQSYYRLERGERRCYLDKALTIAKMLECTVHQLGELPDPNEAAELFKQGRQRAHVVAQPKTYASVEEEVAAITAGWDDDDPV
jgi:transcriptional regulator with XRE-family HTH domain